MVWKELVHEILRFIVLVTTGPSLTTDSGVESSATYIGHEGATSDNELPTGQSLDEEASPAPPTLEDAMQRLAETIREFDSHAMTDDTGAAGDDTITKTQQNVSQGQTNVFGSFLF